MNKNLSGHAIHPAQIRLRRAAWRERGALVQALGIEYDWRYHAQAEWAGRYWDVFGDLERLRCTAGERQSQLAALVEQRKQPACSTIDAASMRALFRHLLACLHPDIAPEMAADSQWARVCAAYRNGDYTALKAEARRADTCAYANGLRLPVPQLRREYNRLCAMRKVVDRRLATMAQQFPYCLRNKLDEPRWIARQRRVWRHMLTIAGQPQRLAATKTAASAL